MPDKPHRNYVALDIAMNLQMKRVPTDPLPLLPFHSFVISLDLLKKKRWDTGKSFPRISRAVAMRATSVCPISNQYGYRCGIWQHIPRCQGVGKGMGQSVGVGFEGVKGNAFVLCAPVYY